MQRKKTEFKLFSSKSILTFPIRYPIINNNNKNIIYIFVYNATYFQSSYFAHKINYWQGDAFYHFTYEKNR